MLENYSLNVYSLTCGLRGTFQYLNRPSEQLQGPVATSSVMPVNPVYWTCYLKWLCITWTFCWPFTAHLVIWGSQSSANPTPPQSSWTLHRLSNILHSPNIHQDLQLLWAGLWTRLLPCRLAWPFLLGTVTTLMGTIHTLLHSVIVLQSFLEAGTSAGWHCWDSALSSGFSGSFPLLRWAPAEYQSSTWSTAE